MAREYEIINTDVVVGYNFLLKKFYISNMETTTYRETSALAYEALIIVAPNPTTLIDSVVTPVTSTLLEGLESNSEQLQNLYYTWHDNGSFIKSIQFNDHHKYPMVLDAFKKKLYVMNANLVFDLSLNESKEYRVRLLTSFYQRFLDFTITNTQMSKIYDLFISFYNAKCYNEIDLTRLDPTHLNTLYYNNIYSLSNYTGYNKLVYSCTENPNNLYTKTDYANTNANVSVSVGIKELQQTDRQIILDKPLEEQIPVGQTIYISNLNQVIDGVTYSADGSYTLTNQSNAILKVKEPLPFDYYFPYKQAYLVGSKTTVTNVTRTNMTITLNVNVPNTYNVGDIIWLKDTQQVVDNQTVTADGRYTIASINTEGKTITVQEQLPCNFSGTAYIYKRVFQGNITKIASNTLTLDRTISLSDTPKIEIWEYGVAEQSVWEGTMPTPEKTFTVASSTSTTITSSETLTNYSPTLPKLQKDTPHPEILIDITTSKKQNYPTGAFMVNNFAQCRAYLETYVPTGSIVPLPESNDQHAKIGTQVDTTYPTTIPDKSGENIRMQLLGIFSQVYK